MAEIKKILILTADAGFGHRSAANAVHDALHQSYGELVSVKIVNPMSDKRIPPFIRNSQSDYDRILQTMPKLYQLGYRTSDNRVPTAILEGVMALIMFDVMWDLLNTEKPDAILVTYPIYQEPLLQVFRATNRFIPLYTAITDLCNIHQIWFNPKITGLIVPTEEVKKAALDSGFSEKKIHLAGIPVRPAIQNEKRTKRQIRKLLGMDAEMITLLAVGSKRVQHLPEFLDVVDHSGFNLQIAAIAGKDDRLYQTFLETVWHHPVRVVNYVSDISPYLHAADMILCKAGGLIVTEALASGLPLILTEVIPGQEEGNATYVVNNRVGARVESPLQMLHVLQHWLMDGGNALSEAAERAKMIGRPNSAFTAAGILWKAAQRKPGSRNGQLPIMRAKVLSALMDIEPLRPHIHKILETREAGKKQP